VTLDGFPRRTLRGDRTIHRIHRSTTASWWFSSDGSGPFDPVGAGLGACYLAERPLGAWVEVFRKSMLLAEGEISARSLFSVELGRDLRLADVTSRRALGFGVTASVGAGEDYRESQAFAAGAVDAGFHGIRYLVRHDPAQRLFGIAVFGEPGAAVASGPRCPAGTEAELSDALIAAARRSFGYRILPRP
jgi:hypothetical protein